MIKLLEDSNILQSFTDICGEKIKSLAISYGADKPFCTFWQQISDSGDITALICKFGSAVTVSLKNADNQELLDFLGFIGFDELVCDEGLTDSISDFCEEKIFAVEKICTKEKKIQPQLTFSEYFAMYQMLDDSNSDAIKMGDFEPWYVDISHRIRHGGAVAVLTEQGCGIGLLSDSSVIINGIAVGFSHRGKGFGREILNYIESFGKTRSMALCLQTELEFYKKCGYEITGNYTLFRKGKIENA